MDLPHSYVLFCCFFFSSFFSLLVLPDTTPEDSPYLGVPYLTCMHNTTNGTSLSPSFTSNLNFALQNLTRLSFKGTKYAQITVGAGDNTVYAMFQCRGDRSIQLCGVCVSYATFRLPQQDCPDSIGARIQLDGCYLRYDNEFFFTLDVSFAQGYCYGNTSDSIVLATINLLVENVTTQAPKQGGFVSASGDGEYAAAQCLGYLNESECSECLSQAALYRAICGSTLGEQVHLTSCYYRFEPYSFLAPLPASAAPGASPTQQPSPLRLPPTRSESHTGSRTPIIAAITATVAIVVAIALCLVLVWRRKANKKSEVLGKKEVKREANWPQPLMQAKARVFSLQELEDATRHFHLDNKLGEGGFGSVYKGTLPNGEQVAIKKLALGSSQGGQEFLNEVTLITSVQHKNLIRLLGCCNEESERILVYEYLPNKSLDLMLFGHQDDGKVLDWQARYGIVLGMAKGLAYLHEESYTRIIHRDIKASNVLLDNQLNPKIADFGLARLVQENEIHVNTRVVGTRGYLAPEYVIHGELSEKVDVFSYGVVALEIISGRQNLNNGILEQAWRLFTQKRILDLIDAKLGHEFSADQIICIAHVGLLCTQKSPYKRPTMSQVVLMLSGKLEALELPCKPAFIDLDESRASRSTPNHQPISPFSYSNIANTQNSFIIGSQPMSIGTHTISEFEDPR